MSKLDHLLTDIQNLLHTSVRQDAKDRTHLQQEVDTLCELRAPTVLDSVEEAQVRDMMRINHCGEVCAQALYRGQAMTTSDLATKEALLHAAQEEETHLHLCDQRLFELNDGPSVTAPLWYLGSYAMGLLAGSLPKAVGQGFIAETETQVERHLQTHMDAISGMKNVDLRTLAILEKMQQDEAQHKEEAQRQGAQDLPNFVKRAMHLSAKIMIKVTEKF